MHGTGCWLGMMSPHLLGGTAVLLEQRGLDPVEVWDTVEREGVQQLIIVGDAFAKPMLRALDEEPGSLGRCRACGCWSPRARCSRSRSSGA